MRIVDWEIWQTYRKDRGQPPWIKVHRRLLRNLKFLRMSDAEKGHLQSMWLLAADHEGWIPNDAEDIKELCHLKKAPDLELFVDKGFIEHDANMTPTCQPDDANMTPSGCQGDAPKAKAETEADKIRVEEKGKAAEEMETVKQAWNEMAKAAGLESMRTWSDGRKRAFCARWKDADFRDNWRTAILKIQNTPFCCGKNDRGWRIDIEFFLKPDSLNKILEGKYDGPSAEDTPPMEIPF